MAEAINALPGEEYRKLWERCRYEPMRLPFRRTTPWRVRPTKSRNEASDPPDTDAGIPDSLPSGDEAAGETDCAAARDPQAGSREAGAPVPAGFNAAGAAGAESGYTQNCGNDSVRRGETLFLPRISMGIYHKWNVRIPY